MKMELITQEHQDAMIYITKEDFIKSYEEDKEKAFKDLDLIIEMFTSLACFKMEFEMEELEEIYDTLKTIKKYSGIVLVFIEFEDDEMGMDICYAK